MTQALYAHMNNKKIKIIKKNTRIQSGETVGSTCVAVIAAGPGLWGICVEADRCCFF
jgi:hypothetical protein